MKPKLADEIGINSARVFGISMLSLVASGIVLSVIWGGRVIQPLEKPAGRVFLTAVATGILSMVGIFAAASITEVSTDKNVEESPDERDKKWEELVEDLWGTEYCIASCKGCKHLVGEVASCTYMVCAMHPYGKQFCPDFERKLKGTR